MIFDGIIISGDFNIHVDDSNNSETRQFIHLLESFGFKQHVTGPTHLKGDTLDLVFSKGLHVVITAALDVAISDHYCIVYSLVFIVFDVVCSVEQTNMVRFTNKCYINAYTAVTVINSFSNYTLPSLLSCDAMVVVNNLVNCINDINCWISKNFLQLNTDKTEILVVGPWTKD